MEEEDNIVRNSFMVIFDPGQVSSLNEAIKSLASDLIAAGGRAIDKFINTLAENSALENIYPERIGKLTAQKMSTGYDRVDADLSTLNPYFVAPVNGQWQFGGPRGMIDADIAIIDTGVFNHNDINLASCASFIDNPEENVPIPSCADRVGHGTKVAGVAAAYDNNDGIIGTAPGARIWSVAVATASEDIKEADLTEGLKYLLWHPEIDVVNLSLTLSKVNHRTQRYSDASQASEWDGVVKLVKDLLKKNIIVVVAAGNEHQNIDNKATVPASMPEVITVAALSDSDGKCGGKGPDSYQAQVTRGNLVLNKDDTLASFSDYGNVIDLIAPGTDILTTDKSGSYSKVSGTSFSAPFVAGAAALYKAFNPTVTQDEVLKYLTSTGTRPQPVPSVAPNSPLEPCNGKGQGYIRYDDQSHQSLVDWRNLCFIWVLNLWVHHLFRWSLTPDTLEVPRRIETIVCRHLSLPPLSLAQRKSEGPST